LQHEIIKNLIVMQKFAKAIAAIMLMTAMCFASGCTKPDAPNNGGNDGNNGGGGSGVTGTYNGHEYVDLGLPSGTLWATCNVGTDTPEGYGDYFAWGETQAKTTYNWSTYKYCNGGDGWNTLTKYCNDTDYGYNGFTDNLATLLPEDDAVTANWGSGWRMPTKAQWDELCQNTTNTWTAQNGVNGSLFTASNGNSLFLPAAGYCYESGLDRIGSDGYYWSSSLDTHIPNAVWVLDCFSLGYGMSSGSRNHGQTVRAVRSAR
jgi:uncharacterized protein (TIGR02145 family)